MVGFFSLQRHICKNIRSLGLIFKNGAIMVIEPGNNNVNLQSSTAGRARQAVPSKSSDGGPAQQNNGSTDSVSLSSAGQAIAKIEANLVSSSEVNESKVAEIKAAIASGQYSVDSSAIADKMLDQDDLLLVSPFKPIQAESFFS